ncbi:hypothetical protein DYB32_007288 [Aphanomyces invadans]|uniref:Uncharacterized protein n=1 Tax=Aphanomyces invadans TaxID=157072 RepID=A0A418AP85_9STRA|nr:hypothetical protein DYB32_007288 [Aphanomyces invadans]
MDTPSLSKSDIESLLEQSGANFTALQTRCLGRDDRWSLLAHSRKVHVTSCESEELAGVSVLSSAKIYATLDEVVALQDNATLTIQHFSEAIEESKVLYVLKENAEDCVVVRWQDLTFGIPIQNRDVVVLEVNPSSCIPM